MEKKNLRIVIAFLCLALMLIPAACAGTRKTTAEDTEVSLRPDCVYVCTGYEKIAWESESRRVLACAGDMVYSVDEVFYYEGQRIAEAEIWELVEDYDRLAVKGIIFCQTVEGKTLSQERVVCETEGHIRGAATAGDGDIILSVEDAKTYLGIKEGYCLMKIGSDGKVLFKAEQEFGYAPSVLTVDREGNAFTSSQNSVYCFNRKGKCIRTMDFNNTVTDICADGKGGVYVSCAGVRVPIVRMRGGKEEPVNEKVGLNKFARTVTGQLLARNNTKAYLYSEKDDVWQELLVFSNMDLLADDILEWWMGEKERIHLIVKGDNGLGEYLVTAEQRSEEAIITKEVLTIGTWGYSEELTRAIVGFNRINEQYRIEIMDYSEKLSEYDTGGGVAAITDRIKLELISGKGPDLLSLNVIDIGLIAEKGMMEDLGPYLENSDKLSREDFFDELLKSATFGGKLAYLPDSFGIRTMVGKRSILGEKEAWTLEDVILLTEKYPQALLLAPNVRARENSAEKVVKTMFWLNQEQFFGPRDGKDFFDAKAFAVMLNKAKEVYGAKELSGSDLQAAYRNGEVLLADIYISSFWDLSSRQSEFFGREPMQVTGYPTGGEKSGHIITPQGGYGIMSFCKNKEAAWEFLEYLMMREPESLFAFSSRPVCFEKQMDTMLGYVKRESTEEDVKSFEDNLQLLRKIVQNAVGTYCLADEEILNMIYEEARQFYLGDKTAEAATNAICNRVKLYLDENEIGNRSH